MQSVQNYADLPDKSGLTPTQIEVAFFVVRGMDNREIGKRMFIEPRSVAFHVVKLMRFFKVNTRYRLICELYEKGWR